jgi:fyn-related kinase
MFKTLQDLITHYQQKADGLCVKLNEPCVIDEWQTDRSDIRIVKKLITGELTEVWEGIWNNNTPVAVKTLRSQLINAYDFLQSANLMKKLHHPNLVQLYAICSMEEPTCIYIITELMKNGSLLEYLHGLGRSLRIPQLIDMASKVAAGMAYLEGEKIIHRDLATRNIQVGDGIVCKVANFELARVMEEDICEAQEGEKFAIKWIAPEAALYKRFSIKSDVWSFGIVLYEIITYGSVPYPGMNNIEVLEKVQQGYRMPQPLDCGCPEKLYEMMLNCWREDPNDRPTFATLQRELEEFFTSDDADYTD